MVLSHLVSLIVINCTTKRIALFLTLRSSVVDPKQKFWDPDPTFQVPTGTRYLAAGNIVIVSDFTAKLHNEEFFFQDNKK